jgi:type II secretory pathway pseudopilin PulG
VIAVIAAIAIPNITGARQAAETARTDYNADAQARFITQVNAVGATNATGQAATTANVTNGATFTNATTQIGFTYNQ